MLNYISYGDFIDFYYKVRQKGLNYFGNKFNLSRSSRVRSKWNFEQKSSGFWIVPKVRKRWNLIISGDVNLGYEDYVVNKYFKNSKNLSLLSVACGDGSHERKFAKYSCFSKIEGIDISEERIAIANRIANSEQLTITYHVGDFIKFPFEEESFDVILFSSSLHHFDDLNIFLSTKVKPLLKKGGKLIIFEFCGSTKFQWTDRQLIRANEVLSSIPLSLRTRIDGKSIKKRIYRPGLIRMYMVDPSESVDSSSLVQAIHQNFEILEEKKLGWNIIQLLLNDIAHNFLEDNELTNQTLQHVFDEEDTFMQETGENDAIFGVYLKN